MCAGTPKSTDARTYADTWECRGLQMRTCARAPTDVRALWGCRDLNTLIHHQDPMIQQVEVNMEAMDAHVTRAVGELRTASRNQPRLLTSWNIVLMVLGSIFGLFLGIELF